MNRFDFIYPSDKALDKKGFAGYVVNILFLTIKKIKNTTGLNSPNVLSFSQIQLQPGNQESFEHYQS